MAPSFELGLFLPSTRGGTIITDAAPPEIDPTWALNRDATIAAERAGMDFVLSQVKWRGYGGASRHWTSALESMTLTAALAAVTTQIRLYASVAVRTVHPAVAAKMAATVDEIAGGRFGLNIVAGWNKYEYSQMGLWGDDDYYLNRYAYADEYLKVLKGLWTEEHFTFKGEFFTVEDCESNPKPRRPLPIVCAGQSDGALAFVAREADFAFVGRMNDTPEQLATLASRISTLASEHGRQVGAYTLLNVIAEGTREEAEARRDHYLDRRDEVAITEFLRASGNDVNRGDYAKLDPITATFMSIPYIVGSYADVAAHIDRLAGSGVRGVCMTFSDFARDVPNFVEHVMPRLACRRPS